MQRCNQVADDHTEFLKEELQVEEDDIFKFNCNDINPDDSVLLLLAIISEDIQE